MSNKINRPLVVVMMPRGRGGRGGKRRHVVGCGAEEGGDGGGMGPDVDLNRQAQGDMSQVVNSTVRSRKEDSTRLWVMVLAL